MVLQRLLLFETLYQTSNAIATTQTMVATIHTLVTQIFFQDFAQANITQLLCRKCKNLVCCFFTTGQGFAIVTVISDFLFILLFVPHSSSLVSISHSLSLHHLVSTCHSGPKLIHQSVPSLTSSYQPNTIYIHHTHFQAGERSPKSSASNLFNLHLFTRTFPHAI